jgi:hypothetical protein
MSNWTVIVDTQDGDLLAFVTLALGDLVDDDGDFVDLLLLLVFNRNCLLLRPVRLVSFVSTAPVVATAG